MDKIRVLAPLDGSPLAEAALSFLADLKGLGPLHVRLIAVAEDLSVYGVPQAESYQDRQANALRAYLHSKAQELEQEGMEVESIVRLGYPAEVLMLDAKQYEPEYVVISTHGHSGARRFRLGSVADKLVRSGDWNTLVVGPLPSTWPLRTPVQAILVPLDGSSRAEMALPIAARLADGLGAKLHLVRAVEVPSMLEDITGYVLAASKEAATGYLAEKANELKQHQPVTAMVLGNPPDALREYEEEHGIGLTVLTSHGRGGLLRATLGSVADRMIGGLAPVLVVRVPATDAE